ncbi:MAG: FAD-dependent oxidoreductase [Puniceicoccaceae bacterium]
MTTEVDVLVVGAGVGGVTSAVAAAREGAKVLLVEKSEAIGGTGVHAYPGLITRHWADDGAYINDGLHRRFFPEAYEPGVEAVLKLWGAETDPGKRRCLNELTPMLTYESEALAARYEAALREFPNLELRLNTAVGAVEMRDGRIVAVKLAGGDGGTETVHPRILIDGTFNANVAAMAGAECAIGAKGDPDELQPATLIFTLDDVDFSQFDLGGWPLLSAKVFMKIMRQLGPIYQELKAAGGTRNPRENVLLFVRRDMRSALMNQTRVFGVHPDDAEGIARARAEAEAQVHEFVEGMRGRHPAFANAKLGRMATQMGLRDGRRVIGDHVLTGDECVAGARFPDMVGACANFIDIHSTRANRKDVARGIANNGYFHIPYRCLTPRGIDNLLIASRAISCDFEAHGATRVMAPICAYSEAAGIAAALACESGDTRKVDIAALQRRLRKQGQFVDGIGLSLHPASAG